MEEKFFRYFMVGAGLIISMGLVFIFLCLVWMLWSAGVGTFIITFLSLWAFGWVVYRLANWDLIKDWMEKEL